MDEQLTNESDPASTQAKPSAQIPAGALAILPAEVLRQSDLHVHLPAGAVPKDGPSAGVTLFVALVSLLTQRRISKDVAMTGEISLRGLILPVGGIKEKVLAAKRAGISSILLPELNRKDLDEIPAQARQGVRFEFLTTVDEALQLALEPETAREPIERSTAWTNFPNEPGQLIWPGEEALGHEVKATTTSSYVPRRR